MPISEYKPIRKYSNKTLLKCILPLKAEMGISRLATVHEFIDVPGIRIVNATRALLKASQISNTQGIGRSLKAAACGALMEAYERHCACWCDDLIVTENKPSDGNPFLRRMGYSADCRISEWISTTEFFSSSKIMLPAVEIQFPYHGIDLEHSNIKPHTSGLASGADIEEATCFAICECLERESTSVFYKTCFSKICGSYVNFKSIRGGKTKQLYESLTSRGYRCFAIKIQCLLPTYYVAVFDPVKMGPKFMVIGSASGFTEYDALDSALLEAIQGLAVSLQASREDLIRHQSDYQNRNFFDQSKFDVLNSYFTKHYPSFDLPYEEAELHSMEEAMNIIDSVFQRRHITECYIADLSKPTHPVKTVKAVIPGVFDWHVNPMRLNYEV